MKKISLLITFIITTGLWAQSFGQNKVQYTAFDWNVIKSPHFDIFYYGNNQHLAEFTAEEGELAYEQVSKHMRWTVKKPITVILYASHNDFQQTNVVSSYMPEGVGGVTELFKNRMVIPFEGSYDDFRHVIHHELVHAFVYDYIYGGNIQGVISGRVRIQIPLWLNEGLAEFLSSDWDTRADMIMRDLAIHEYMPRVQELDYYLAYKGGQSVWKFVAEKYGRETIGEIFQEMKKSQNAEKGFEHAIGMDFKELTKKWHTYLKKEYWPDIEGREPAEDIANKLTDHQKLKNYFNIAPSISPDGSKIALLSDRSGYADIYLIDAFTGEEIKRLIKGNRTIDFEELKWLQSGITWSPDSKKIIIAAKAGKNDVFHVIDVKKGNSEKINFKMDGVFTPAWNPDGQQIAFVGNQNGSSDIYLYNLETKELQNLTQDRFSDSEPVWNPDGTKLAFISDRENAQTLEPFNPEFYRQTDLFILDLDSQQLSQVTDTEYDENYPAWSTDGQAVYYTADYNGIWNIFYHDLQEPEGYPITNSLIGIQQLSISHDGNVLIFTGYSENGWDIYSLPLNENPKKVAVEPSKYFLSNNKKNDTFADLRQDRKHKPLAGDYSTGDYSSYIFLKNYESYNNVILDEKGREGSENDTTRSSELFIPKAYKTRFTLDVVSGVLSISNQFGARGMTYFSWSDILGDHQFTFGTEMVLTLENSDYYFSYAYLKNQTDFYFAAFQNVYFFGPSYQIGRLRNYGFNFFASRPFNRFNRIDAGFIYSIIDYKVLEYNGTNNYNVVDSKKLSAVLPAISWVLDNTRFGMTGPVDGFRQNISLTASPGLGSNSLEFQTWKLDSRKYLRIGRNYSVAFRIMLGHSSGKNAQKFFLGGTPYWLFGRGETEGKKDESQYRNVLFDNKRDNFLEDIYFSEYAMPIRGSRFAERIGSNVALANFEFRFPFINYLSLGFPLKMIFGNITGHTFFDIGAAWDDLDEFNDLQLLRDKYDYGEYTIPDDFRLTVSSFGVGTKIFLGYFLLRIDTAWDINPGNRFSRPQYYFSLGPDW